MSIRLAAVTLLALSACNVECRQSVNWLPDQAWDHIPVTVRVDGIDSVFDRSIHDAMAAWNRAAGCTVLAPATDGTGADVVISPYDGFACGSSAQLEATHDATAGHWRCSKNAAEVKLRAMSDIRSVYVVVAHELGHVLGLDHDRSALMNAAPELYDPAQMLPLPSEADGAAIRGRYCR